MSDNCFNDAYQLLERTVGPIPNIGDNDGALAILLDVEHHLSMGRIVILKRDAGVIRLFAYEKGSASEHNYPS